MMISYSCLSCLSPANAPCTSSHGFSDANLWSEQGQAAIKPGMPTSNTASPWHPRIAAWRRGKPSSCVWISHHSSTRFPSVNNCSGMLIIDRLSPLLLARSSLGILSVRVVGEDADSHCSHQRCWCRQLACLNLLGASYQGSMLAAAVIFLLRFSHSLILGEMP